MVLQDASSRRAFHSICLETGTASLVGRQYFTFTSALLRREGNRNIPHAKVHVRSLELPFKSYEAVLCNVIHNTA